MDISSDNKDENWIDDLCRELIKSGVDCITVALVRGTMFSFSALKREINDSSVNSLKGLGCLNNVFGFEDKDEK